MWALYEEYAQELQVAERFNPTHEWKIRQPPPLPPPAVPTPLSLIKIEEAKGAYLEAVNQSNVFLIDLTIERTKINTPFGPQDATAGSSLAEMAPFSMKSKSTPKREKGLRRAEHDDVAMPFDIEMVGMFCVPDESVCNTSIMREGFITDTDFLPSAD